MARLTFHQLGHSVACTQLAGGREINRQLSGDALHHPTRPAARKQLTGRGQRVQTWSKERKERERGRERENARMRTRLASKTDQLCKPVSCQLHGFCAHTV